MGPQVKNPAVHMIAFSGFTGGPLAKRQKISETDLDLQNMSHC
jgi:hypothetical protein